MQTGYCLGAINSGGYIFAQAPGEYNDQRMVHRETIFPWPGQEIHPSLADAKEVLIPLTEKGSPGLILEVRNGAGVQAIWCASEHLPEVKKRLKTWSGCYGAWPVKLLGKETSAAI